MTFIEKILAAHSDREAVKPGDIVDIRIDVRLARDFGGANVVHNLQQNHLVPDDSGKTFFTFDCNPTGSDQKYAANQQLCRMYARDHSIPVFDINMGIGTHLAIDQGLAVPGATVVSTDSHANILGAIGAFGQGMGDRDIAAAWARGSVWFKVPETVKIRFTGKRPAGISAKDMILNMLHRFGADSLLGCAVELDGEAVDALSLDERITIASMATEMGAIIILLKPSESIRDYCAKRSGKTVDMVGPDADAAYLHEHEFDLSACFRALSRPGKPHDVVPVAELEGTGIDSVFIGSCTNGRMEDMRVTAEILQGRKVAPGVVLKIVPATDEVWNHCLQDGLLKIFKDAGALVGNAGCAGCASGQIGQNGPGEKTVSTGNRNFAGKQGKGEVFLASPAIAAASAIAGHIAEPGRIPAVPKAFSSSLKTGKTLQHEGKRTDEPEKPLILEGKVWFVAHDNIDTDMIYHNQHLSVTRIEEMGKYAFGNLKGWEDYPHKTEAGDILICGNNFGAGSSRQQAVDCFRALKNQAILARSFGAIYERNAINAGFPVLTYDTLEELELRQRDTLRIELGSGMLTNLRNGRQMQIRGFSSVQMDIYQKGDLLKL